MRRNIREAFASALTGAVVGGVLVKRVWLDKYHAQRTELEAAERERELLYAWLLMERSERGLPDYFDGRGLKKVAVLGMNRLGRMAIDELGERATYGVEAKNYAAVHERLTVYRLGEDELPEADALLVCDLGLIDKEAEMLRREFSKEIVALPDVFQRS